MFFEYRTYQVERFTNAGELVARLRHCRTWCVCKAFAIDDLILANDSTGPDGIQEYAALTPAGQIDSLTVDWMNETQLVEAIARLLTTTPQTVFADKRINTNHGPNMSRTCCA